MKKNEKIIIAIIGIIIGASFLLSYVENRKEQFLFGATEVVVKSCQKVLFDGMRIKGQKGETLKVSSRRASCPKEGKSIFVKEDRVLLNDWKIRKIKED